MKGRRQRWTWTASDPTWASLTPYQRAAAMALLEADRRNPDDARNALGAMINRAAKAGEDLGVHVSKPIYQPTFEPAQHRRLPSILNSQEFRDLTGWAERRSQGLEKDPVNGATHFLAPPSVMLALEKREPNKYKNWGPRGQNWTGYDPKTGQYRGTTLVDRSHHFLAPHGPYSVAYRGDQGPMGPPRPADMQLTSLALSPTEAPDDHQAIIPDTPQSPFVATAPIPAPAPVAPPAPTVTSLPPLPMPSIPVPQIDNAGIGDIMMPFVSLANQQQEQRPADPGFTEAAMRSEQRKRELLSRLSLLSPKNPLASTRVS